MGAWTSGPGPRSNLTPYTSHLQLPVSPHQLCTLVVPFLNNAFFPVFLAGITETYALRTLPKQYPCRRPNCRGTLGPGLGDSRRSTQDLGFSKCRIASLQLPLFGSSIFPSFGCAVRSVEACRIVARIQFEGATLRVQHPSHPHRQPQLCDLRSGRSTAHNCISFDLILTCSLKQVADMAFSGGLNERMGELRFPNVRSPNEESQYSGYTSPPRAQNSFFSSFQQPANDSRSSLQRRFTTDSSRVSVSSFGTQYSQIQPDYSTTVSADLLCFNMTLPILALTCSLANLNEAPEPLTYSVRVNYDLAPAICPYNFSFCTSNSLHYYAPFTSIHYYSCSCHADPLTDIYQCDVKTQQIEAIRAEKRKMEAQMKLLDLQEQGLRQPTSTQDMDRVTGRLNRVSLTAVSEPTTPPEYAENGFSSQFSRPGRYSMNNITSPPGLTNRFSQSSSHITSPPSGTISSNGMYNQNQKPPAKSMPGSRRNSDEEEYFPEELPVTRSAAS